ncbi:MAG: hybrid sensor histidine kinase/response regulator [Gammaproteobacteria bacterium]
MPTVDDTFHNRLLATFRIEAQEHLDALFAGIVELEQKPDEAHAASIIETVFREAHSLKGAARAINLTRIESDCQALESILARLKNRELSATTELINHLLQSLDRLSTSLALPEAEMPPETEADRPAQAILPTPRPTRGKPDPRPGPDNKSSTTGTVRIAADRLDAIFLQAEEMLSAKLLAQQRRQELKQLQNLAATWDKDWANLRLHHPDVYREAAQHPQLLALLEKNAGLVKNLQFQLSALASATDQDLRILNRMVTDLLSDMKKALMLPFSTLTESIPRMVREFARNEGKEIILDIRGGEIEADRRILDEIKDPLLHLIRNCIDHGIEMPARRTEQHKPRSGTITITFRPRDGNRVEITVADDGAGIDVDRVKESSLRLGILSPEQLNRLDRHQIIELIYQSGVSTRTLVTEISGRGLGLAIVQEKVENLGASMTLDTELGRGTTFRILLPLLFATYRGIVVRVNEQLFVLPAASALRVLRIEGAEIMTVENRQAVPLNGEILPLVRLGDALGLPRRQTTGGRLQLIVLTASRKRIAFVVDEVMYEQEVLVKSLGKQLRRTKNLAGATILGTGSAVPVLNVSDLMKSALSISAAGLNASITEPPPEAPKKSVLVVEDSITARNLFKNILENAGYRVATAIDGIDGLTRLRSGDFDAVVTDVEMPRMNGFELTAEIRSDKTFRELPVVLITALASREDRERGMEVGANAYIVKSSFEQSNLLDVLKRLV